MPGNSTSQVEFLGIPAAGSQVQANAFRQKVNVGTEMPETTCGKGKAESPSAQAAPLLQDTLSLQGKSLSSSKLLHKSAMEGGGGPRRGGRGEVGILC